MVMGSVSGLSLADHCDPGSFLVAHAFLRQDGGQREGFRDMVGYVTSSFDLSLFFRLVVVACEFRISHQDILP